MPPLPFQKHDCFTEITLNINAKFQLTVSGQVVKRSLLMESCILLLIIVGTVIAYFVGDQEVGRCGTRNTSSYSIQFITTAVI